MGEVVVGVGDLVVDDAAVFGDGGDFGVDETAVGFEAEFGVAFENFFVEVGVDVDGVGFYEGFAGFVVAFGLDALDFGEELCEETAEGFVVVDDEVGLAVTDFFLYDIT